MTCPLALMIPARIQVTGSNSAVPGNLLESLHPVDAKLIIVGQGQLSNHRREINLLRTAIEQIKNRLHLANALRWANDQNFIIFGIRYNSGTAHHNGLRP